MGRFWKVLLLCNTTALLVCIALSFFYWHHKSNNPTNHEPPPPTLSPTQGKTDLKSDLQPLTKRVQALEKEIQILKQRQTTSPGRDLKLKYEYKKPSFPTHDAKGEIVLPSILYQAEPNGE